MNETYDDAIFLVSSAHWESLGWAFWDGNTICFFFRDGQSWVFTFCFGFCSLFRCPAYPLTASFLVYLVWVGILPFMRSHRK